MVGARGVQDSMRTWSSESTKQGSMELTETEATTMDPALVCTRSSAYILWFFSLGLFIGFPIVGAGMTLALLPAHGTCFLLLDCLVHP